MRIIKKIISKLPLKWQHDIRKFHFRRQINQGKFNTNEPEYLILETLVSNGDWAIDVGANVGHYTNKLCELVGKDGRVVAFEPILETFSILADNLQYSGCDNVTLFNAALSNKTAILGFDIPTFDTGLNNYYQAHVTQNNKADTKILAIKLDDIHLENRISLIKIDAEGHEDCVLDGMMETIKRDKPTLIIENNIPSLIEKLAAINYEATILEGSPNIIFRANK